MGKGLPPRQAGSLSGRRIRTRRPHPAPQDWRNRLSGELSGARRLFVLGVGNRRKADDGAGNRCVRFLQQKLGKRTVQSPSLDSQSARLRQPVRVSKRRAFEELQVLDAGEAPENATGVIRRFGPTHVLIVDAAIGGHEPGSIFVVDRRKIRQDDPSTHRIPLIHLVRFLDRSVKCRVIVVGIEPRVIAWNRPMSPAVKTAAARLARTLLQVWTKSVPADSTPQKSRTKRRQSSAW